jgi:protein-L-isoaspartate(D-aspartate) O-methyltransferase
VPPSDFEYQRRRMVQELSEVYGIQDQRVCEAMLEIPRHLFVRQHLEGQAYGDFALPIEAEQTISQPYIVARMTEMLKLEERHKVLEIGTGSGYQTAILATLSRWVYSLERIPELAHKAIERMRRLGISNVKIQVFDGTVGWSEMAPFDRILVTAAAPEVPKPLLEQLAVGGLLVLPEGDRHSQRLISYRKLRSGRTKKNGGEPVVFVPLVGRYGWKE